MRILIFGAGAVGTYIGCSLKKAGANVVFFDRPDTCASIRQNGLHVKLVKDEIHIHHPECASTVSEIKDIKPFDLGVMAVKSFDTAGLLQQLETIVGILPPVLSLQNGVENEGLIQNVIGVEKTLYGSVATAIFRSRTGEVAVERLRGIGIAGQSSILPEVITLFNIANLRAKQFAYEDALSMKWSKMISNLLTNAQAAILQMPPAAIMNDPRLFAVEAQQMIEVSNVMHSLGLRILDIPHTPVKIMTWLFTRFPRVLARPIMARSAGKARGEKLPSLLLDIKAGRKYSEVHYLNGAVARFGEQTGMETPVNRFLNDTLQKIASGEIDGQIYAGKPERFLADLADKP
jgi:2-dehydropantoate 2-reductase